MGGKPSKATSKDMRLKANQTKAAPRPPAKPLPMPKAQRGK